MFYGLLFTQYVNSRCIDGGDDYILANTTFNQYLLPAMIGLEEALKSTVMHPLVMPTISFPPSAAYFASPLILPAVIVQDGALGCTNILDALLDVAYSALEKASAKEVEIIKVTETEGHPARERKSRLLLMHKLIITT
ncbi:hypothetical protein NC651_017963 [Populus alba x Populus x berolinensis]|nr:hypothetical protein NC651_017963 [Populus alba x Populus x berolinensis]